MADRAGTAEQEVTGPQGPLLFLLAAFLLVFAPLILGGNRPLPLLVLEIAGLAGLAALFWQGSAQSHWRPLQLGPRSLLHSQLHTLASSLSSRRVTWPWSIGRTALAPTCNSSSVAAVGPVGSSSEHQVKTMQPS